MAGSRSAGLVGKSGDGVKAVAAQTDLSSPDFALPLWAYLSTPRFTAVDNPVVYNMPLPIGVIRKVWIEMPRGCGGQVGLMVTRGPYQIFPAPAGVWYRSDNTTLGFALTHNMTTEPYDVNILTYNLDVIYNHTPWIAFEMTGAQSELTPELAGLVKHLKGI